MSENLTPAQLRAARALLNWSRADLAEKTGISEQTIHRFENNVHVPSQKTKQKLFDELVAAGIGFTEDHGVKFRANNVEIFEGPERFDEFYDFLYQYLVRDGSCDVCLSISDQSLLDRYRKDPSIHYKRVKALYDAGKIKKFRILAAKSKYMHSPLFSVFKVQPEGGISPTAFWAFGEYLALISFIHSSPPYVVLLRSATLAEAYRQAFNVAWKVAKNPMLPKSESHKERSD